MSTGSKAKTATRIGDWIEQHLGDEEPKSKSLIVTVFGDSIAPRSSGIWLGDLISLMAPFGVSERLVRTSSFRLVDEDWLEARRDGRRSYYSLTASGARRLELAYERVYTPPQQDWDGYWTVVIQPRNGEAMPERVELRRQLEWEGFASPTPGVMLHPAAKPAVLRQILADLGLSDRVALLRASSLEGFSAAPIDALIMQCWNLDEARQRYLKFAERFQPLMARLDKTGIAPQQAFIIQTLLIHAYRRLSLHDPRLPNAMLPTDWPGLAAFELCRQLYQRTWQLAQAHVQSACSSEDSNGVAPRPAMHMEQRFGGLLA